MSDPTAQPTTSPVSWQTAFWSLVPLAISTMTQPSGQVCGTRSRWKTYLRSSPIICVADSFYLLIQIILFWFKNRLPLRSTIRILFRARFDDVQEDARSAEGFEGFTKTTAWRWLFFIIGALGPGIKLLSFEGVPWTQVWGAMFLFGFVSMELLAILSYGGNDDLIFEPEEPRPRASKTLFKIACIFHVGTLVWVTADLYYRWSSFPESYLLDVTIEGPIKKFIEPLLAILLDGGKFSFVYFFLYTFYESSLFILWLWWINGFLPIFIFCAFLVCAFSPIIFVDLLIHILGAWGFHVFPFPSLLENLDKEDSDALPFALLIYTLVLSTLWYGLKYDSSGTINPGWTGVFG